MRSSTVTSDLWPEPHLQDLARETLELLRVHLRGRRFRRGNLLWREGDTSGMLVALKTGRVKVYRLLPAGHEVTLFLFGPGDVFGFLPFLDGLAYPAFARAIDDVEADVMPRAALLRAIRAEPELALGLIGLLGGRLRTSFDLIRSLSTPARARVAQALLAVLPSTGIDGTPTVIRLPVSNREFAGALGLAPETLSRILTAFAKDGILARRGFGRYEVRDQAALRTAAHPAAP